jgi:hypothetical protein
MKKVPARSQNARERLANRSAATGANGGTGTAAEGFDP